MPSPEMTNPGDPRGMGPAVHASGGFVRSGKVRDLFEVRDQLLLVASDRLSAFDVVLPTPIPDKGRVLLALVEEAWMSREEAYAVVQRNSMKAADERRQLRELLAADPDVAARLSDEALAACFDESHFLRNVATAIARLDGLVPARKEAPDAVP